MIPDEILLVDDNPEIRRLMRLVLDPHYTIREAGSGADALELIRRHKPSLVVMDTMMPGEIDGLETLKVIRSEAGLQGVQVIMVSARGEAQDIAFATKLGAADYFVKPFSALALVERIRQLLAA